MSEGASSSASAGQSAGNAGGQSQGQQGESSQGQQGQAAPAAEGQPSGGGGEAAVSTSAEATQASFEKAATDTMNHETKEVVGDEKPEEAEDDYVPPRDYIRKKYADEQFDDDDKVDRKAYKHIKDLESYQDRNRDANKKVMTLFNAHPELVGVLQDMDAGADFAESLALNLSPDQRKHLREVVLSDDFKPENETWATKKTEREQKFTERQKWSETYATNRKESTTALKEFATENNLDQTGLEDFARYADSILANVYNGKVDKGFLNALHKARTADAQISKAAQVAEVKGRNAAIAEKAIKADPEGDGLPDLSKGGETKDKPKMSESDQMFSSLIDGFKQRSERFK